METIIDVKGLCKTYIVNKISNNVLRNVDFSLHEGEFVSIMGPSGSGKSTMLYTISGMDRPTAGDVTFLGKNYNEINDKEMAKLRLLSMGFIFQQMYMMRKLCILDNILLPAYHAGIEDRKKVREEAEMLMRRLGIMETADNGITEVSGGQLQRACLCRALINHPKVLFADEPTGALNSKAADEVIGELVRVNRDGTAILMVTHSARVAAGSERVLYFVDGHIEGELQLGKLQDEADLTQRERQLNKWLMTM
ncbi:MAG: ABC transporter ATP-binding protein [Lachnospiraceae bacterium]|nr:ABC transporter ATP-binding protein [Lachnospiraceae bacterium]MBR6156015.1 ABC transporter ATP-binding protein [Lachnospiraceae bacterium]